MVWRSLSTPSSAVRLLHTAAFKPTCICLDENYRIINKAQHTYHPRGYENSQGYLRARKPYAVRNALTFLALASFVGGVYAYSIMMVEQDDFSDLESFRVIPDAKSDIDSIVATEEPVQTPDKTIPPSWTHSLKNRVSSLWSSAGVAKPSSPVVVAPSDPTAGPTMNKKAI